MLRKFMYSLAILSTLGALPLSALQSQQQQPQASDNRPSETRSSDTDSRQQNSKRPNILVIMGDDIGYLALKQIRARITSP